MRQNTFLYSDTDAVGILNLDDFVAPCKLRPVAGLKLGLAVDAVSAVVVVGRC